MTFIPMAIWLGAPKITVGLYIWKGIIPTLLGNIIGGGLFVGKEYLLRLEGQWLTEPGTYYWYMYLLSGEMVTLNGMHKSGMTTPRSVDIEAMAADKQN